MHFLHLSLLVAICFADSMVSSELELEVNTLDDGFRSYAYNHLAAHMRSIGIEEYFVSKNLIINKRSYGPRYHHLKPHIEGACQFIDKLDFGNNANMKVLLSPVKMKKKLAKLLKKCLKI